MSGKVDPSQNTEDVSPKKVEREGNDPPASPIVELNETLNIARAFNTIRRDATNSGQKVQVNLGSVLKKDLTRRLNSLVLISGQDRESVITRTPSRSIATSTPYDSANPSPKPPLKKTPSLFPPRDSQLSVCSNYSEISSINSEVFLDTEHFNPQESEPNKQPPIVLPSRITQRLTMNESAAVKEIVLRGQVLTRKIQTYLPEDIDETDINEKIFLAEIEEVKLIQEDVLGKIDKFLYEFPDTGRKQFFEEMTQKVSSEFRNFKLGIKARVSEVKRNMTSSSVASTAPLVHAHTGGESDLTRRTVEAMERGNMIAESQPAQAKQVEREQCVKKAKSIYDNLKTDIPKLDEKINDVVEWADKDDNSISRGMRKLDKWEGDLKDITMMLRKLVDLKNVHDIQENEVRCEEVEVDVQELEEAFKEVKEKLEAEDEERGLYSLEKPKTTSINLPTFSGKDFEDFSKFKIDMQDGFKTNRVSKKEQIHKLRECLKGQARKLIPDSNVTDVGTAWEVLQKAYGNPIKIIKQRKEALLKLGRMPGGVVKGQDDLRPQIAWFLDITTFLKELIELGKKNSEYKDVAFSNEFAAQLRYIFPLKLRHKLRKCEGEGLELFESILVKIEELRENAQEDQQDIDIIKPIVSQPSRFSASEQRSGSAAAFQNEYKESDEEENVSESSYFCAALIAYKPPRRDEKC